MLGIATEAELIQILGLISDQDTRITGLSKLNKTILSALGEQIKINDILTKRLIALEKKVREAK